MVELGRPAEPQKGERVVVHELTGYRLHQERPLDCRLGCVCGQCNGKTIDYPGVVTTIINWMDNSREAQVLCDDGRQRIIRLARPSGDASY
jgi:hypothetical protein